MLVLGGVTFKKDQPRIVGIENRSDRSGIYSLTVRPSKMTVGRRSFPFEKVPFQGTFVNFRGL